MPKDHRLKPRTSTGAALPGLPLNFLLGCSQKGVEDYELARLDEVAGLRKELHAVLDRLVEQNSLANLARWFRESDRAAINAALATEVDPVTWAKQLVAERSRTEEEQEGDLIPLASLPPGAAHLAAAMRYQDRNLAKGLCSVCPQPLDPNSVCYCTKHLVATRERDRQKKGLSSPGGRDYLYAGEIPESTHGRQPGTLASLAMNRETKTRALLAELGIKPESAAVSRKAAKESLLAHMPQLKESAMPADELFTVSLIPSKETGRRALRDLLTGGLIQRSGEGSKGDRYLYWKTVAKPLTASEEREKRLSAGGKSRRKNEALLKVIQAEDDSGYTGE